MRGSDEISGCSVEEEARLVMLKRKWDVSHETHEPMENGRSWVLIFWISLIVVMTSIFNGWSAHEIVGPLNKAEVRKALLDYDVEKSSFRTWDSIEKMVLGSSDEIKEALYQSGMTKKKIEDEHRIETLKRRQEAQRIERNVRRRIGM